MSKHVSARILGSSLIMVCVGVLPAQADLSIAKAPTSNVSCTGAGCVATAPTAVLNVADLRHLLAKYPAVSVDAAVAKNMTVDAGLSWTSSASLALTASGSLIMNKPVTVAGDGSVAIQTADLGLSFAPKASVSFWNLSSGLTINNVAYTLIGDVKTVWGFNFIAEPAVAFARDYDASGDGSYVTPIGVLPHGAHLEGLGHTISHLTAEGTGLIDILEGTLTNLHLANEVVYERDFSGGAVHINAGLIDHVSVTGTLICCGSRELGGLADDNTGTIRNSWAKVRIPHRGATLTGGLVAQNSGTISNCWADGTVGGAGTGYGFQGGLVGFSGGIIENSYSLADTRFCIWCKVEGGKWRAVGSNIVRRQLPIKGGVLLRRRCNGAAPAPAVRLSGR